MSNTYISSNVNNKTCLYLVLHSVSVVWHCGLSTGPCKRGLNLWRGSQQQQSGANPGILRRGGGPTRGVCIQCRPGAVQQDGGKVKFIVIKMRANFYGRAAENLGHDVEGRSRPESTLTTARKYQPCLDCSGEVRRVRRAPCLPARAPLNSPSARRNPEDRQPGEGRTRTGPGRSPPAPGRRRRTASRRRSSSWRTSPSSLLVTDESGVLKEALITTDHYAHE